MTCGFGVFVPRPWYARAKESLRAVCIMVHDYKESKKVRCSRSSSAASLHKIPRKASVLSSLPVYIFNYRRTVGRPFVLRFERFNSFQEKFAVGVVDLMKNHHVHTTDGFSFIIVSGVAINQTVRGLIVYDIDVSAMAITRW